MHTLHTLLFALTLPPSSARSATAQPGVDKKKVATTELGAHVCDPEQLHTSGAFLTMDQLRDLR